MSGKVVIVSGAAGSLGRATAALLASEGVCLVVTDGSAAVHQLSTELAEAGASCEAWAFDVRDGDAWIDVTEFAVARFGRLDGMANFAGVLSRPGIEQTTREQWDRTIQINLTGTWLGMSAVVPALRRSGGGSIVNVGSIAALVGRRGRAAYQASKGGVRMLSKSAASQYAPEGIRVNCVHPGPMEGLMAGVIDADTATTDRARLDALRAEVPMGRLGHAVDVAHGVRFLLSDESAFITGIDLAIDGGLTAQ